MPINVGIRSTVTRLYGQASFHRESAPEKSVCGVALKRIRPIRGNDWYRRCPKCFDQQLGKYTDAVFPKRKPEPVCSVCGGSGVVSGGNLAPWKAPCPNGCTVPERTSRSE